MIAFLARRLLWVIPFFFALSLLSFFLIQLPPGDYLSTYAAQLGEAGEDVDSDRLDAMRERWGLGDPFHIQYVRWMAGVFQGDFGYSFEWRRPVSEMIGGRMGLTVVVAFATLIFAWGLAIPIGIFSAVRQYSVADYIFTLIGFIGLAVPNFILALIFMYVGAMYFGASVGGLFSPEYVGEPLSVGKILDLLKHIWVPMVVVGTAGTAQLVRIMRANLLDELRKPYVETARAKGLSEFRLVMKYPVRVAINPAISIIGFVFPQLISGVVITAIVLNLPTAGPLMLQALQSQDMYLGGAFVLLLGCLTILGMIISDILLAIVDPRIRLS